MTIAIFINRRLKKKANPGSFLSSPGLAKRKASLGVATSRRFGDAF